MPNTNQTDLFLSIVFVLIVLALIVLGIIRKRKGYDSEFSTKTAKAHKLLLRSTQIIFWLPMSLILLVLFVALLMLSGLL